MVMVMDWKDYKVILYRNQPSGWVAEISAIEGCDALMPTRTEALSELRTVFGAIATEYQDRGLDSPVDTTELVHA